MDPPTMDTIKQKTDSTKEIEESKTIEDVPEHYEADFEWSFDVYINLLALYMTYFSCVWGQTASGASIGFITKAFPEESALATWVAGVTSLALCSISIFVGEASDIFGRRYFLIFATVCGMVGNLISSRAKSVAVIVGGQTITAVGMTIGYLTTPLLAEIVPKRSRSIVISITTFLVGIVGIGGNVALGAMMQASVGGRNQGWRVGFYLGAGFFGIALILLVLFYHPGHRPNPENLSVKVRLLHIDWVGILLGVSGLTLTLVGLQLGGSSDPWKSATIISLITIGGVLLIVFGIWEWKFAKNKLVPNALFQYRNYTIGLIINFIEGVAAFGSLAFTSLIVLNVLESRYLLSTVYNFPSAGGTVIGAGATAYIVYKTKEVKWTAIYGCVSLTLGIALMTVIKPHVSFAAWFFPQFISGNAIGIFAVLNPVIATVCTPNEYVATSVSVGTSIRGLGGAVATVMLSTIFQNKITSYLPGRLIEAVIKAGLPASSVGGLLIAFSTGDSAAMAKVPGFTPEIAEALSASLQLAYADAFRYIWYSLIPFCVLTFISVCFLQTTKPLLTQEVASAVEERHNKKVGKDIELEERSTIGH